MYPYEFWLSRVAGVVKHLVNDGHLEALTMQGYKNLMDAYYAADTELNTKFQSFIISSVVLEKAVSRELLAGF